VAPSSGGSARMSGPRRLVARFDSSRTGPFQRIASWFVDWSTSHGRTRARRPSAPDLPASGHPQVAAEHEPALEREQEVLSYGFDSDQHAPVEPFGELFRRRPRMRRFDRNPFPDEQLEPARGAVERVALGHGRRASPV
jgi:hypothetical protein